jgi:ATPase subunit of ABC transporter with duplicated ATPase domains
MLFVSHDHQFIQTIATRIIEITPNGLIDKMLTFDEYLEHPDVQKQREQLYG